MALRTHLAPYVKLVVEEYIKENGLNIEMISELYNESWSHLQLAIKRYIGRTDLMSMGKNDVYYFPTYFNWYVRQSITEYLVKKSQNSS